MGLIIDEKLAKNTPCSGYVDKDGEKILYSSGVIGTLSDKQETTYCTDTSTRPLTTDQQETHTEFTEASQKCEGKPLRQYLTCMSNNLTQDTPKWNIPTKEE